jgi:hypothetical protein
VGFSRQAAGTVALAAPVCARSASGRQDAPATACGSSSAGRSSCGGGWGGGQQASHQVGGSLPHQADQRPPRLLAATQPPATRAAAARCAIAISMLGPVRSCMMWSAQCGATTPVSAPDVAAWPTVRSCGARCEVRNPARGPGSVAEGSRARPGDWPCRCVRPPRSARGGTAIGRSPPGARCGDDWPGDRVARRSRPWPGRPARPAATLGAAGRRR